VTNETMLLARRHAVRSSIDLVLFFRAIGALHTNFILLGADFIAEIRSFFIRHKTDQVRALFLDALQPEVIAGGIHDRFETEQRLNYIFAPAKLLIERGVVRARFQSAGSMERAATLALMPISITVAAFCAASSKSIAGDVAAATGAAVLVAMIVRPPAVRKRIV